MINKVKKHAEVIKLLKAGLTVAEITKKTGIKSATIRSWQSKYLKGFSSQGDLRYTAKYDSGTLQDSGSMHTGWDVGLALDLLRLKWTEFPRYFRERKRRSA